VSWESEWDEPPSARHPWWRRALVLLVAVALGLALIVPLLNLVFAG